MRSALLFAGALATALGLRAQGDYATPYTFTTLSGKVGVEGNANGTGTSALFAQPEGVAVDGSGNLYVADSLNHEVRKISSAGVVTTLVDGAAIAAAANFIPIGQATFLPFGLAVDSAGNVYVSDSGYRAIWMITSAGAVTPVAGGGASVPGTVDGTGSLAGFREPMGIGVDTSGNLYVADGFTIRKVVLNGGTVTTMAGNPKLYGIADGTGAAARFGGVTGVAVDGSGNIFATDDGNFTIRKITSAGVVTTIAGSPENFGYADGTGSSALFYAPEGIAVDGSDNLYVTVADNTIRKITSAGVVTTLAGKDGVTGSADGTGAGALFNGSVGIAVDSSGDLFVADSTTNTIRERYAAADAAPTITVQPAPQSVALGASVTFTVQASGVPTPSYQWQFNGANVGGATNPSLTVANVQATSLGGYAVVVSNSVGSVTSNSSALSSPGVSPVAAVPQPRLVNISSRAYVGTGASVEIAGFVVAGPPGSTDQVLIRGIGPTLAQFGVGGELISPVLTLFDSSGVQIGVDDLSWGANTNFAQIVSAETTTGAFPLNYMSADSALLVSLAPGNYTAEVSATSPATGADNKPGVALAEIYEVSSSGAQIVNISTRAYVGTGSNVEIAGIVVTGGSPAYVLVRAVGPALAQFGVSGVLAAPSLSVADSSGNTVATNTGWSTASNAASVASATATVGAFALPSGSADCALLLTLQPGSYTAVVSGVGGTTGVALVEVYQIQLVGTPP
jgi:sugar lactone lactonase YvrE